MKRILQAAFLIIPLLLSACGPKATPLPTATLPPTAVPSPTTAPSPTPVPATPTPEPSPTPLPTTPPEYLLTEPFDQLTTDWTEPIVVTSQTLPDRRKSTFGAKDAWLLFDIQDSETYMYTLNKNLLVSDVALETVYVNSGPTQTGVALICRAKGDYSAWYEFRISHLMEYAIYEYDRAIQESGGNPYTSLANGPLDETKLNPATENRVRVVCQGNKLSLELNGNLLAEAQSDALNEDGLVGLGVLSHNLTPVNVWFDFFNAAKP